MLINFDRTPAFVAQLDRQKDIPNRHRYNSIYYASLASSSKNVSIAYWVLF